MQGGDGYDESVNIAQGANNPLTATHALSAEADSVAAAGFARSSKCLTTEQAPWQNSVDMRLYILQLFKCKGPA
jgi:hypothetical protein